MLVYLVYLGKKKSTEQNRLLGSGTRGIFSL